MALCGFTISFDHITWNVAEPSFQERCDVLLSRLAGGLAGLLHHDLLDPDAKCDTHDLEAIFQSAAQDRGRIVAPRNYPIYAPDPFI